MVEGSRTIGVLARESGLSVRTLRYYDAIGLLAAPYRGRSGRRLYGPDARKHLLRVLIYRDLGFSLKKIRELLSKGAGNNDDIKRTIAAHVADLKTALERQQARYRRAERLLKMMDITAGVSRGLTSDAQAGIVAKHEKIRAAIRRHMEAGVAPTDPRVHAPMRQQGSLGERMMGGRKAARAVFDAMRPLVEDKAAREDLETRDPAITRFFHDHFDAMWGGEKGRAFVREARMALAVGPNGPMRPAPRAPRRRKARSRSK